MRPRAFGVETKMKLCASYHSAAGKWQKLNEIRYPIAALDQAIEAIEKYPSHTIIIEIVELKKSGISGKKYAKIVEENPTIVTDCYNIEDLRTLRYFSGIGKLMYHYPVNTFTDLRYLLSYAPCSVVIAEPLTFELPRVRAAIMAWTDPDTQVDIRVKPALGRPTEWNHIMDQDDGFCHFWLPPQWIPKYEQYIDVLDLYDRDQGRESALIDIYYDKKCDTLLSVLVQNCEMDLPCEILDDELAEKRITCGQHCMEGVGRCHYCDMFAKTAKLARPSQS